MIDSETEYLLRRATQEAAMAAQAKHPAAAAVHRGLSLRYSAKAAIDLAEGANDRVGGYYYQRAGSATQNR
jgi:hypothetical protein